MVNRHKVCNRRNGTGHGNRDVNVTFWVTRVLHTMYVIICAFFSRNYDRINKIKSVSFVLKEIPLVTNFVT